MKTEQQKPSAGAMRAADAVAAIEYGEGYAEKFPESFAKKRDELAVVIDRHSGLREMAEALERAVRYIEVVTAYKGSMTAEQVEQAIKDNAAVGLVSIGCNSANTLASFDFIEARAALACYHGKEQL